jgi:hypothetical protein
VGPPISLRRRFPCAASAEPAEATRALPGKIFRESESGPSVVDGEQVLGFRNSNACKKHARIGSCDPSVR